MGLNPPKLKILATSLVRCIYVMQGSGGATPGRARSNELARRSTALPTASTCSKGDKLLAFAKFVSKYDESFYELNQLIGIAVTLPVTSVEAEQSFSSLKLIKTHLRTTMLDDRLSDSATLSVHSQRANALDLYLIHDLLFLYNSLE